jgi:hypothetical protein
VAIARESSSSRLVCGEAPNDPAGRGVPVPNRSVTTLRASWAVTPSSVSYFAGQLVGLSE